MTRTLYAGTVALYLSALDNAIEALTSAQGATPDRMAIATAKGELKGMRITLREIALADVAVEVAEVPAEVEPVREMAEAAG